MKVIEEPLTTVFEEPLAIFFDPGGQINYRMIITGNYRMRRLTWIPENILEHIIKLLISSQLADGKQQPMWSAERKWITK